MLQYCAFCWLLCFKQLVVLRLILILLVHITDTQQDVHETISAFCHNTVLLLGLPISPDVKIT